MGSFREDHMTEVKFKPNVCILLYSAWFSNSVVSNGNCLSLQNPLDCGDGVLLVCSFSTWLCQRIRHQSSGIPGRTTKCGENQCTASGLPFAARKLDYASHSYFVISSFPAVRHWMPWKRPYSVMNTKQFEGIWGWNAWKHFVSGMDNWKVYSDASGQAQSVATCGSSCFSAHVLQWYGQHSTPVMHNVHTSAHVQKPYCHSERAAFTRPLKHAPT